jgi:DNA-binding NtrC family response regulator
MKSRAKESTTACRQTVLVVDDDLHILEVLDARLTSSGFVVLKAAEAKQAMAMIKAHRVELMISDVKMPEMSGFNLFSEVRELYPDLPVIFLTAYGTIPDAVKALKAGVVEYFTKPFDGLELVKKVCEILKVSSDKQSKKDGHSPQLYQGDSLPMKELYEMVPRAANSDINILLLGESGVGKERLAHQIHELSPRKNENFVVVDCGSTPTTLLESELFGHVKGSFTHAVRDKIGLIETADRGTLFLDEIGNISPEMQVRLLRFLEDRKIRKIGDVREKLVDCRVIAATNENLVEEIKAGKFREDLYYRLRVVTFKIPPLRDRKEDIPALALHFVKEFSKNYPNKKITLLPETMQWMCKHSWPGNVREMKNTIEAAIVLCKDGQLHIKDLHLSELIDTLQTAGPGKDSFLLHDNEQNAIIRALQQSSGVQKEAAKLLGISRRAIHYKIKKYDIKPGDLR